MIQLEGSIHSVHLEWKQHGSGGGGVVRNEGLDTRAFPWLCWVRPKTYLAQRSFFRSGWKWMFTEDEEQEKHIEQPSVTLPQMLVIFRLGLWITCGFSNSKGFIFHELFQLLLEPIQIFSIDTILWPYKSNTNCMKYHHLLFVLKLVAINCVWHPLTLVLGDLANSQTLATLFVLLTL